MFSQVHPNGIRHIRSDGRINEWKTPGRMTIVRTGYNRQQVVIALSDGKLIYFELDITGQLIEVEQKEMSGDVACLDIAPVPEGRQRSRFLAVGSFDSTIRILSLDPDDCMQILSVQALSSPPESILLLDVQTGAVDSEGGGTRSVFLNAGLQNGVLLRTEVDMVTGQLSDTRTRFLGLRAPKLFPTQVHGGRAMLCLSSRPWLGYTHQGHFQLTPLSYETLEHASSFSSDQCPEGVVAVADDQLRVFTIERLGETFNSTTAPLRYTPRKFVLNPQHKNVVVIEADQGALTAEELQAAIKEAVENNEEAQNGAAPMEQDKPEANGAAEEEEEKEDPLPEEQYGYPKATSDQWASCIRVMRPFPEAATTCLLELEENECALSLTLVNFHDKEGLGTLLAVGTARDLQWYPKRASSAGFIHIYR